MISAAPLVSVVIPAYNAERTIWQAIRSALDQTFGDIEVIVCNDASSDRTRDVVGSFEDARVRMVENAKNLGEGAARDRAIDAARGKWLAVLDADDAWHSERIERLLLIAGQRDDCLVFDDLTICHDTPHGLVPWRPLRGPNAFETSGGTAREIDFTAYLRSERLLIKPMFPARCVRGKSIRHSSRRFGADSEYFIRLAHSGIRFIYLPEPLYLYRVTPGSATGTVSGLHLMRECISECASMGWKDDRVLSAFQYKIDALRTNEALYELAMRGRKAELFQCMRILAENPSALRVLPKRAFRHLSYQLHRVVHYGAGR